MDMEDGRETVEDENGRITYMEYKPAPAPVKEIRIKNTMEMEQIRKLKEAQEDFENLSRLKKDMVKRKLKKLRRKYGSTASQI